jgi:hypothetical protein
MDKFRAQSLRFGTKIITETVSKIDLSTRPFRYWREDQEDEDPETADAVILATGASARRLGLPGEETYWQSGISACAVCDGAVPIFRCVPRAARQADKHFDLTLPTEIDLWPSSEEATLQRKKPPVRSYRPPPLYTC